MRGMFPSSSTLSIFECITKRDTLLGIELVWENDTLCKYDLISSLNTFGFRELVWGHDTFVNNGLLH